MSRFYETIPQTAQEATISENKAISQEKRILDAMTEIGQEVTAWDLWEHFGRAYEITGLRRGLWNLEFKDKAIEQTGWVKGRKGVRVGKFRVKFKTTLF